MPENKTSSYNGYTEARARANAKYISQFVEIKVRTTAGQRDTIKAAAAAVGESVNGYIKRAIEERMERDRDAPADGQQPTDTGGDAQAPAIYPQGGIRGRQLRRG